MKLIMVLLLGGFFVTQITALSYATEIPGPQCERWLIAIIPTPDDCTLTAHGETCQPPEGWEPVSGITYGENQKSGVLLRRCVEK
jgi:hypothetical protein